MFQPRYRTDISLRVRLRHRPVGCKSAVTSNNGNGSLPTKDFICPDGTVVQVMKDDYGFRTGSGRLYEEQYGEVPASALHLAIENFKAEWLSMRRMFVKDEFQQIWEAKDPTKFANKIAAWTGGKFVKGLQAADNALVNANALRSVDEFEMPEEDMAPKVMERLRDLKLDASKVAKREEERFKAEPSTAPWFIKGPYFLLCWILDLMYEGRPIQRFWVLEEVARMPYFAFIAMLHLYESLGWWRAGAALRRVHFAEEWNELHHLQIMESLGGDNAWVDRFIAQHSAIAYFWGLILMYAVSPKSAYQFSELVEGHATDTYEEFVEQNKALLKTLPPPSVAVEYYCGADVYMFRSFQISPQAQDNPRLPDCNTLLDVFMNIRDDEVEHQKTMAACQDPAAVARDIADQAKNFDDHCRP